MNAAPEDGHPRCRCRAGRFTSINVHKPGVRARRLRLARLQDMPIAQAPQGQCRQHDEGQHHAAAVGQDERGKQGRLQQARAAAVVGGEGMGEGGPEQGVRHPHLGGKAIDERQARACRDTGEDEKRPLGAAVEREGGPQSEQGGREEQQTRRGESRLWILPVRREIGLRGEMGGGAKTV